jgi:hypothetical protein
MITDKFLRLSEAQAILGTDLAATDVIDLSQARDIGEGTDLYMVVTVITAFAGGTSIEFIVKGSTDATIVTGDTTLGTSGAIGLSSLSAGAQFFVRINPQFASTGLRYIGAFYDVTGTMSAGTVTTDIVLNISDPKKYYSSGFLVT